ncbi:MAG: DUF6175 family protein [Bacteroidales bacterium]|nr:DUF6175 family protein [Bacteroidales bacterium]
MHKQISLIFSLFLGIILYAQDFSNDVVLVDQDSQGITVTATASAEKKDQAKILAAQSAFYTLFHEGIPGLRNGKPLMANSKEGMEYRFFNEKKYLNYISGKIEDVSCKKVNSLQRATVRFTISLPRLLRDLERNNIAFTGAWQDQDKEDDVKVAYNPTIVVVPYIKGKENDFAAMKALIDRSDFTRQLLNAVSAEFSKQGYKTRDFVSILQNYNTSQLLMSSAQTDLDTKVVQALPGDILVTVDGSINIANGTKGSCTLSLTAIEKQTNGNLGGASFSSGQYTVTDSLALAKNALKNVKKDFFTSLSNNFSQVVQEGREVYLEFALSSNLDDWDFDQKSPSGSDQFKSALQQWLRSNAQRGVQRLETHTSKYILASINVPLWNANADQAYTLYEFSSDLQKFLDKQLGLDYKASITSLGQRFKIVIE